MNPPRDLVGEYGERAVMEALRCLEARDSHDFSGRDAELVEALMRAGRVRAVVQSRFLTASGELRLRVRSDGLTVAGSWLKSVLERGIDDPSFQPGGGG